MRCIRHHGTDDGSRHRRRISASSEQTEESPGLHAGLQSTQRGQFARHERRRGCLLAGGVDRRQCCPDRVLVDAAPPQLAGHRPRGQPALMVLRLRIVLRGHDIVDQAYIDEPVQNLIDCLVRHAFAAQRGRQFGPGPRSLGEQSQANGASDRCRIIRQIRWLPGLRRRPALARRHERCGHDDQKSTGAGSGWIGAPASSNWAPMPSFSLIFFSISSARSGLSRRKLRTFSLP